MTEADTTTTTGRRLLLAGAAAVTMTGAAPAALTAANPDADLIAKAKAFIARERQIEPRALELAEIPCGSMTAAERAECDAWIASARGYHEDLDAISCAEPQTREGLIAQARVMLWHHREPSGDGAHAWNLAESVFRVLGEPMPEWAI